MTIIPTTQIPFDAYMLQRMEALDSTLSASVEARPRTNTSPRVFFDMFLDNIDQAITLLERSVSTAKKCKSPDISFNDRALLDTVLIDLEAKLDEQLSFPLLSKTLNGREIANESPQNLDLSLLTADEAKRAHETLGPLLKAALAKRESILVKIETLKASQ